MVEVRNKQTNQPTTNTVAPQNCATFSRTFCAELTAKYAQVCYSVPTNSYRNALILQQNDNLMLSSPATSTSIKEPPQHVECHPQTE